MTDKKEIVSNEEVEIVLGPVAIRSSVDDLLKIDITGMISDIANGCFRWVISCAKEVLIDGILYEIIHNMPPMKITEEILLDVDECTIYGRLNGCRYKTTYPYNQKLVDFIREDFKKILDRKLKEDE